MLVVGSEGQGLGPSIRRRCDLLVRIAMRGSVGSLNAAVAGSIVLFEALGQRGVPDAPVAAGQVAEPADASPEDTPATDGEAPRPGSDPIAPIDDLDTDLLPGEADT